MGAKIKENVLMNESAVVALINDGRKLILSGDDRVLSKLPKGNWIGGTIPYFYLKEGNGKLDQSQVMVSDFTDSIEDFKIASYSESTLHTLTKGGFANGFNFLILPALRDIHKSFALNSKSYEDVFLNPLIGLIAGAELGEFTSGTLSKTYNGQTGESFTDDGVVFHAKLKDSEVARLEIVNVFEPSNDFTLEVNQDGFIVDTCLINGEEKNLYDYIKDNDIDISYPLMSNSGGANINVSFQTLNDEDKKVVFYAPLFKGKKYFIATKFESYADTFKEKSTASFDKENHIIYNCNCILNYLYGGLDKSTIGLSGATTFGEIAYTLLNQTFTYLAIDETE